MRRRLALLAGCLGLVSAGGGAAAGGQSCASLHCAQRLIYIGRHAVGNDHGIVAARFDTTTGVLTGLGLAARIEQPTWLESDPERPVLYSVNELGNKGEARGAVYSLAIDPAGGMLRTVSQVDSGGGGATNLAYEPRSATIFVANYGGGQVGAIPVGKNGRLAATSSVQTDAGSGPNPRQKGPHAHGVAVDPSGAFVLVPDLGADRIFTYKYDATTRKLTPASVPFVTLPPGSGPRHLVFSPNGQLAFAVTELSAEVFSYRWDAKAGQLTQLSRTALDEAGFAGKKSATEIAVSHDGRFVYVSNRAENMLQVYAVDQRTGALATVQRIGCGGTVPWSFTVDPDGKWLLVANEASNTISVFSVDRTTGRLAATGNTLSVASPVNIAFYPN